MSLAGPEPQPHTMLQPPSIQSKKKSSIFGGLFATKEPTQKALNQVAAQMMAQHGSTTPGKVPHVSIEKMPEFVPKVNSKWDGVPGDMKDREKREKDRQKALRRQSMASNMIGARSVESSVRSGRHLPSADSSSRDQLTISSRGRSSKSHRSDPRSPNPHKFYAQSVNSSGDLASQQRPEDDQESSTVYSQSVYSQSQSTRYSSTTSLPNITTSIHEDIPAPPPVPAMYRLSPRIKTGRSDLDGDSKASKPSQPVLGTTPPAEAIPQHTSSPIATPREGSPVTPSTQQAHESLSSVRESIVSSHGSVFLDSTGPKILPLPETSNMEKPLKRATDAFLAGEARPLELPDEDEEASPVSKDLPLRQWGTFRGSFFGNKAPTIPPRNAERLSQDGNQRPDSSRSRLGRRAHMLVRPDAAPREEQALSPQPANAREPTDAKRSVPSLGTPRKKKS